VNFVKFWWNSNLAIRIEVVWLGDFWWDMTTMCQVQESHGSLAPNSGWTFCNDVPEVEAA
jgi:hypothetical protein